MSFKESNLFGNESNDSVKHGKRKEGSKFILEEKDPDNMFLEPVHVGQCPLCGGDTYSENDLSNDPSMSERCCKCNWWKNQFLDWDDINDITIKISPEHRPEEEYKNFGEEALSGVNEGDE